MHTDASDYTFRIHIRAAHRNTSAAVPRILSDTGERWLKSFAFHFARLRARKITGGGGGGGILTIPELAPLRRIVKLRALTPPETCLLRGIARPVVGTRASFPAHEDKTLLKTPKFNTGKVVERRTRDTRRKRDIPPLHAQHALVIILPLSLYYRILYT